MRTGIALGFVAIALAAFWLGRTSVSLAEAPVATATASADAQVVLAPPQAMPGDEPRPSTLVDILRLPGDFAQTTALYALIANADEKMLARLLDEAAQLEPFSQREAATSILYQRFVDIDPSAATAHVLERGGPSVERFAATV